MVVTFGESVRERPMRVWSAVTSNFQSTCWSRGCVYFVKVYWAVCLWLFAFLYTFLYNIFIKILKIILLIFLGHTWQHIKKQRHYFANKGPSSQGYGFSSGHVWMWELDYKESWVPKNWCFWTVVLEKTLESPLDCKEIQPVHPKGDQSWVFIERTDAEAETPIFWPPDVKSWLIGKDPDAGKDWVQEKKGTREDEMVGWHHQLDGHGFGWTPGVGDGQGGLAYCSSWSRKESDMTEWLNWTELGLWDLRLLTRDWTHILLH